MSRRSVLCCCAIVGLVASEVEGQQGSDWEPGGTFGDVAYLSLNGAVAGLSAGIFGALQGRDFSDAFVRGALGGAVAYGGKRLAAARFDGAGLLGRQVSAMGVSMVRNAADGRGAWERLAFPVGPIWLYMEPRRSLTPHVRVNVAHASMLAFAVARPELEIDWGATLSAGAPVFQAVHRTIRFDGKDVSGVAVAGLVVVEGVRRSDPKEVLAHERVHVLQEDFIGQVWSLPLDRWLVGQLPGSARSWFDHVDLSLVNLIGLWQPVFDMREAEADFLHGR